MVNLQVKRPVKLGVDKSILINAAQLTLDVECASSDSEISIVIGNDKLLKTLNEKYRHVDAPTDVLSFSSEEIDLDDKSFYLGDVVISLPRAEEQAASAGHSLDDELQLLVIHGTLHLLGYDHDDNADKLKMKLSQERILAQLGILMENTL